MEQRRRQSQHAPRQSGHRTQRQPLEGVTVVSLEQAVAAPFATRQLADLGARVIKVARMSTHGGDSTHRFASGGRGAA